MVDAWSGLADLLANLIEKYWSELDLDDIPDPVDIASEEKPRTDNPKDFVQTVEIKRVA